MTDYDPLYTFESVNWIGGLAPHFGSLIGRVATDRQGSLHVTAQKGSEFISRVPGYGQVNVQTSVRWSRNVANAAKSQRDL